MFPSFQEHDRQYMHIGTMVEFAFALVGKLDLINKHSFNDFKLRVGESSMKKKKFNVSYFGCIIRSKNEVKLNKRKDECYSTESSF